jgi:hypothetical protein
MQFARFSHVPWPEAAQPSHICEETTEQIQGGATKHCRM